MSSVHRFLCQAASCGVVLCTIAASPTAATGLSITTTQSTTGQFVGEMPELANHCFEPPTEEPLEVLVPCQDWQRAAGSIDVPSIRGGHHVYEFVATAGCTYTFSFCQKGGEANYDTGLSIWNLAAATQLACNVDTCGDRSEITWTAPADGDYLLRIGGMIDVPIGFYTLAYRGCDGCATETSVESISWSILKRLMR